MTRKSRRADRARRTKVLGRLRSAEEKQRHVELRLHDADPVAGFVVGLDDKHVELTRLGEPGTADGIEVVRLRDVRKVRRTPAPVAAPLRGRFAHLEEVEELAQAVVDEAFEEGWPYDAQGIDQLTELQRAIRELACVVRRVEETAPAPRPEKG
ncbi:MULTISPECIES: hypothetical protein [unclassified Nocardioides]|uniref:hypothetical protein n=1 Tax=unclassified Nocardioides TaxID=2615069 RepID=UPI0012F86B36|nr:MULTISPECIES: hypothetical protein [unclassified Nocardioides]